MRTGQRARRGIVRKKKVWNIRPSAIVLPHPTSTPLREITPAKNQPVEEIAVRINHLPVLSRRHPVKPVHRHDISPNVKTAIERWHRIKIYEPSPTIHPHGDPIGP